MRLTQKDVDGFLLPVGNTERFVWDDAVPGFGVRLRAGGARTYVFQYKLGQKQRRVTLGTTAALVLAKARSTAAELYARVRLGQDPQGHREANLRAAVETVGAILPRYLARKRNLVRPRSYLNLEHHLLVQAKPLHGLPLAKASRREVSGVLSAVAAASGVHAADKVRTSLSALFAWCVGEGLTEANPVVGTATHGKATRRDRVLTSAEIATMWDALDDDDFGNITKLLLLTGQRREELSSLRWSEVDFDRGLIRLPASRTKNGLAHDIPMSDPVLAILKSQPQRLGRDLIFGRGAGGFSGWGAAKCALDKRAPIASWRTHDLRRTCATGMGDLGVQPHVVEAVLNHVSGHKGGVAGTYNHASYEREKAAALALWADHVLSVTEKSERKVVPLRA